MRRGQCGWTTGWPDPAEPDSGRRAPATLGSLQLKAGSVRSPKQGKQN